VTHTLPEYRYIVEFLIAFLVIFAIANIVAALNGYREK